MKKSMAFQLTTVYALVILLFLIGTFLGNQVVTVLSENQPVIRKHCVIIDPGHGGEDGGATSCTGKLESGYNLEIALRLNDLIHLLGYNTVMTRTNDTAIYTHGNSISEKKVSDLKERIRIVNACSNGLLLSIHQNQFPESKYWGAQVFYANSGDSRLLAKKLQNSFIYSLNPGSKRQEKVGNGIYLLEKAKNPGVLIECGFLSNPAEEAKLSDSLYQKKLVCVIASVVSEYLSGT